MKLNIEINIEDNFLRNDKTQELENVLKHLKSTPVISCEYHKVVKAYEALLLEERTAIAGKIVQSLVDETTLDFPEKLMTL